MDDRGVAQVVTRFLPTSVHAEADAEMQRVMDGGYRDVQALLRRNRAALDE
jgi:hypothetical protein